MRGSTWCLTAAVTLAGVSPAVAQEEVARSTGSQTLGIVSGLPGDGARAASSGEDGSTTVMTSGGIGLRLTRTWASRSRCSPSRYARATSCLPLWSQRSDTAIDREGGVTAFVTKATFDVPIAGGRLIPYVTGGGGVGYLSERVTDLNTRLPDELFRFRPSSALESSEIGHSLMMGGGLDVSLRRDLTVGADVRWLRLAGHDPGARSSTQVAVRARYSF